MRDGKDKALTSREMAAKEAALVLQFADGRLEVSQGDDSSLKRPAKPARKKQSVPPKQDDLFG